MFQRPWHGEAGHGSPWRVCGEVLEAKAEPWHKEKALPSGMCVHECWCVCSYQHMYTLIKLHLLLPLKFYERGHMVHYSAMACVCVCIRACVHSQACSALAPGVAEKLSCRGEPWSAGLWVSRPPQGPSLALGPPGHEYISIHLRAPIT